jgi:two-component system sensor histidine kinase PilS (NtrC family)
MNEIIQNILQLSRKEQPMQELIPLSDWLADFIEEFSRVQGVPRDWAALSVTPDDLEVLIDPNHLHQVLWNLCANAIKYGTRAGAPPAIDLNAADAPDTGSPHLDVVDHGPGIEPDAQANLFEPFYTTSTTGTGLGLYISRQLCQNNGGELSYHSNESAGSCFRIQFPRHQIEESHLATRAYR